VKVADMIPHFIKAIAMRKLQKKAEELAIQKKSKITLDIVRTVTDQYTPTRFKSKFLSALKENDGVKGDQALPSEVKFTMTWDAKAKAMMNKVPKEVRAIAISGTEEFAQEKGYKRVTVKVVNEFKKESGMGWNEKID
jgi:hypothetical protein